MTTELRGVARRFVDSLDDTGRSAALAPFDTDDRREWTYLPGPRPGVAVGALSEASRELLEVLLGASLSPMGADRTRLVMNLDDILREVEREGGRPGWERRSSDHYWVRVLGDPDDEFFAWHLGGHHVGLHVTLVGESLASTPSFLGANPAVVQGGPRAGLQVLREEESLARDLLAILDDSQRQVAVVSPTAPSDIATRHDPVADPDVVPSGLAYVDLEAAQQKALETLVRWYLGRARDDVAAERWQSVVDEGLDAVTFAWAGGLEPGQPHYYAVKAESFLIEYDNTQDGANHAHTVWRDLRRDWGEDLLAQHHARAHS